jgi:hypothetical protein
MNCSHAIEAPVRDMDFNACKGVQPWLSRARHHAGGQALVRQRHAPCRIPDGRQLCRAPAPAALAGAATGQPQQATRPGDRQGARAPAQRHLALGQRDRHRRGRGRLLHRHRRRGLVQLRWQGPQDARKARDVQLLDRPPARAARRTHGRRDLLHPRRRVRQRRAARVAGRPLGGVDARARSGDARARCTVRFRHPARPLAAPRTPASRGKRRRRHRASFY